MPSPSAVDRRGGRVRPARTRNAARSTALSADYLHGKTTYSGGYISSNENDYDAKTGYLAVSQDMFGDLTTVSFGYTRGKDKVGQRGNPTFAEPVTAATGRWACRRC